MNKVVPAALVLLTACPAPNPGGTLRSDAVVIYKGPEIDSDRLDRCAVFPAECSGIQPIAIADVAREGNDLYVLARPGGVLPSIFASHDLGKTWTEHPIPPSYDTVEGVEDGDPGNYILHAWQGHLYLLVGAITVQMRYHYYVPAEVDLEANTYHLRTTHLDSVLRVANGKVQTGSNQGGLPAGAISWNTYDFVTDTLGTGGNISLIGQPYDPRSWSTFDGTHLVATSNDEPTLGSRRMCHHTLDTSAATPSFTSHCMPRLRVPLISGSDIFPYTVQFPHAGEMWHLTPYRDHALLVGFLERNDQAQVVSTIDLGPGKPSNWWPNERRFAGFIHVTGLIGPSSTSDDSRLVRVNDDGTVEDATVPRTPCIGGGVCGWAGTSGGYGQVQWLEPIEGGEVLSFSITNQSSTGRRDQLVVTHERPTFKPVVTTPIDFGLLAQWPEAQPPSALDLQCVRAIACGVHPNLLSCKSYWSTVRRGPGGVDTGWATFMAVPPGSCDFQPAYADRLLNLGLDGGVAQCAPGCSGAWATYSCVPWGNFNQIPRQNCAALGATCRTDAMGRGYCGTQALNTSACDTCAGQVATACADIAMPSVLDCAALGGTCHTQVGHAFCAPGSCGGNVQNVCRGEVKGACGLGPDYAITGETDCARLSAPCATPGQCLTQPNDCVLAEHSPAVRSGQYCDDGVLAYCDGTGAPHVLDCRSLGLSRCQYVQSTPTQLWANCVP